jgi:general secretion pathway protein E
MRLGELLVQKKLLDPAELEKALTMQAARPEKLGRILSDLGFVAAREVQAALSEQLGVPLASPDDYPAVTPEIEGLSQRYLRQFHFVPLRVDDHTLTLAMTDPLDAETISAVRMFTHMEVRALLAGDAEVAEALEKFYPQDAEAAGKPASGLAFVDGGEAETEDIEHLRDMASEAPVIRLVNNLIARAVERRASDIHLEPFERDFRVRYRIDGVLVLVDAPARELRAAVVSRIKLMARLNIAERRLPQDGRIQLKILGRDIDLRVSTLPTLHGESVVMRLLDRSAGDFYEMANLGFPPRLFDRMTHYISRPHGIFLVTGPTGSGKSTTLYSALKRINLPDKKIITIEDPVEYQMDGINQIHVNPQIGLTFAAGLRHIVRQDPDVIMVGEIRDRDTADIAIRAALTGHLVFSTLHTNDAPSAVTRLTDMGVEPYLIASSVLAILAQRLVRVRCRDCGGTGCANCNNGYRGRKGIYELMEMDEDVRRLVMQNADATQIAATARRAGMKTLKEDGLEKVEQGMTTMEEVLRVTQDF